MSSRLSFNIARTRFRPDIEHSVRKTFRTDLGTSFVYPVAVSFKTPTQWSDTLLIIYDTGATATLLPARYADAFEVKQSVPIILGGMMPGARLNASLTRLKLRFEDGDGKTSPEIEAWVAIAERDDAPPVLGMKDISTAHKLIVNPEEGKFYLQFK